MTKVHYVLGKRQFALMSFANRADAEEMMLSFWEEKLYEKFYRTIQSSVSLSDSIKKVLKLAEREAYCNYWIKEVPHFE
jgi:hypothetical protein